LRTETLNERGCTSDAAPVQRLTEIECVTINLPGGRDFDANVVAVAGTTAAEADRIRDRQAAEPDR